MTSTSLRTLAAVLLTLTLLTGVYLSGKARRDTERRLTDLRAGVSQTEAAPKTPALAPTLELDPQQFEMRLREDAERFGIEPVSLTALAEPNAHFVELRKPITLSPGKSWSSPHVSIKTRLDKVAFMQRGAEIRSVHVIARVANTSKTPIAYRLRMRGDKGKCEVHGSREHNAVTLRPGEENDIVVCAGRDSVVVESLEVLEVSELGHHYLSQVSPLAFGADGTTARAHRPQVDVAPCVDLDARMLAGFLEVGSARWVDIADFFSRHNCHHLDFFPEYRFATEPVSQLPARPPA